MEEPTLPQVSVSTVSLSLPGPVAPPDAIPFISPKAQEGSAQRCTICNSMLNQIRIDGTMEQASILPCSHVFGHICIQRWLETDSLHQDCPICRRSLVYRICGHVIKACEVEKAPEGVREEDMPEKCMRCKSSEDVANGVAGGLKDELRQSREMMLAQERALEGMRRHLPGIFGGMCSSIAQSVDARIEELKREWGREADAAFGELEEKEGRAEW